MGAEEVASTRKVCVVGFVSVLGIRISIKKTVAETLKVFVGIYRGSTLQYSNGRGYKTGKPGGSWE